MSSRQSNENNTDFREQLDNMAHNLPNRLQPVRQSVDRQVNRVRERLPQARQQLTKLQYLYRVIIYYKFIPLIVFALLYIVSPVDLIPELWLGVIGVIDDVLVILGCIWFYLYNRKVVIPQDEYRSVNTESVTDEELYSFITVGRGDNTNNPPVRENNSSDSDVDSVSELLGSLSVDDTSGGDNTQPEPAARPSQNQPTTRNDDGERDTRVPEPNVQQPAPEPRPSVQQPTPEPVRSSEPISVSNSCFTTGQRTVSGQQELLNVFNTESRPTEQRIGNTQSIW